LGGKWGSALKFAGYDALAVQGKANKPVYLFVHNDVVEIKDALDLWGQPAFDAESTLRERLGNHVSVLTIGPAGENQVVFATAMADAGASVSGGLGSVMGSKNLKAIVVNGNKRPSPANPERLQQLVTDIRQMKKNTYEGFSLGGIPGISKREMCYGCRRYKTFCQSSGVC
jgi:aldehyde:ferredoxin oxidoreductase